MTLATMTAVPKARCAPNGSANVRLPRCGVAVRVAYGIARMIDSCRPLDASSMNQASDSNVEAMLPKPQARSPLWSTVLMLVGFAVGLGVTILDRVLRLGIADIVLKSELQSSVVLGVAILLGSLWIGYFVVLREYLGTGERINARLETAALDALADQNQVREAQRKRQPG
jgi:hypothetical protein